MSTYYNGEASQDEWISQAEAARLRRVSRQAIARLIKRGRLATRTIAGYVLVRKADVLNFSPRAAGRPRGSKAKSDRN